MTRPTPGVSLAYPSEGFSPGRTVTLAKDGGDVDTLADAITEAAALSPSATSPVMILVYPGIYDTATGITLPAYVTVYGFSDELFTISATVTTITVVTISDHSAMYYGKIRGASGVGGVGVLFNSGNPKGGELSRVEIEGCETGVKVSGGTTVELEDVELESNTTDLDIGATDDCHVMGVSFDRSKLVIASGGVFRGIAMSHWEGEVAHHILHELHVGRAGAGRESAIGEGDSFGADAVFCDDGLGVFTDRTTEATSASGSTFSLFSGLIAGAATYIGSDVQQFPGLKVDVTGAITLGAGAIIWEYWDGTLAAWTEFAHMNCDADWPYAQYAQAAFQRVSSEQIRFDPDLNEGAVGVDWAKTTVNGKNSYWIRIRIATAITTTPVLEQIKVQTNHTAINADAVQEFMGKGRPLIEIARLGPQFTEAVGFGPKNADINFSPTVNLRGKRNQLQDNAHDGFGDVFEVPAGTDTSAKWTVEIWYTSNGATGGDVEFEFAVSSVQLGDLWAGANPEVTAAQIVTIAVGSADVVKSVSFEIDARDLLPGDRVGFVVHRDATGVNLDDTLVEHVNVGLVVVTGRGWR